MIKDMLVVLLLVLSVVRARGSVVCDSSPCNVDTSHSFEYVYDLIIDYPTQGITVVDSVSYDGVIQLNVLDGQSLSYSWELFNVDAGGQFDCSTSRLWLNGTSVTATTYLRGATNDIPYCIFDIHNGVLSREYLLNPTNMFLLMNSTVPVGDRMVVQKNFNNPVIAKQDIRFYLYDFVSLNAVGRGAGGDGTDLTIVVQDIPYTSPDFTGIGGCNTMDTRMSSIQIGTCTFPSVGGSSGTYHYFLPKDQYESCAKTRTYFQEEMVFGLPITLAVDVGTCSYFRPYDAVHEMNVLVPRTIIDDTSDISRNVFVQVVDYAVEICDPFFYIIPQARTFFTVNFTFYGDDFEVAQLPYLGNEANVLEEQSRSCVPHYTGYGSVCTIVFRTLLCRPVYITTGETCSFDRNDDGIIRDIVVEVVDGTVTVSGLDSEVELQEFDPSDCEPGDEYDIQNVTDTFVGNITMRNLPDPDWGVEPEFITFYDPIIVQMNLDIQTEFEHIDVNLMSLLFKIKDPSDGSVISQYTFNKIDKMLLNFNADTHYYDDSHYCTYASGGVCEAFYDEQSDRINPYTQEFVLPVLEDTCQTNIDRTSSDYFAMLPTNWFDDITIPLVIVDVKATAVLFICDDESTASRRLANRDLQGGTEIILFMEYKADAPIRTGATTVAPTPLPTRGPLPFGQTHAPTPSPSTGPTPTPTNRPTGAITPRPSRAPSTVPTVSPSTANVTDANVTTTTDTTDTGSCMVNVVVAQTIQLGVLTSLWFMFCRKKKTRCKYDAQLGISTSSNPGQYYF